MHIIVIIKNIKGMKRLFSIIIFFCVSFVCYAQIDCQFVVREGYTYMAVTNTLNYTAYFNWKAYNPYNGEYTSGNFQPIKAKETLLFGPYTINWEWQYGEHFELTYNFKKSDYVYQAPKINYNYNYGLNNDNSYSSGSNSSSIAQSNNQTSSTSKKSKVYSRFKFLWENGNAIVMTAKRYKYSDNNIIKDCNYTIILAKEHMILEIDRNKKGESNESKMDLYYITDLKWLSNSVKFSGVDEFYDDLYNIKIILEENNCVLRISDTDNSYTEIYYLEE